MLASCGGGTLEPLVFGSTSTSGGSLAESKMSLSMPAYQTSFVFKGELGFESKEREALRVKRVDTKVVSDLAGLFGESERVREESVPGWSAEGREISETRFTVGGLSVSETGFYYWNNESLMRSSEMQRRYSACSVGGYNPDLDTPETTVVCGEPYKAYVDESDSLKKLESIEPDVKWRVSYRGDWSLGFVGRIQFDGVESEDMWYAEISDAGLMSMSGVKMNTDKTGRYPTISTTDALKRLNLESRSFAMPYMSRDGSQNSPAVSSLNESSPADTVVGVPAEPLVDECLDCQRLVELVSVEESLIFATDVYGNSWMMPAWVFKDEGGVEYRVSAISDEYYQVKEPSATTVPPVTGETTATGVTPVEPAVLNEVVGLSLERAEEAIRAFGMVSRVVSVDGESMMVTEGYRTDRVNIEITDGLVSKASIG